MHTRPVRQRGLNRAGETLLGRGLLLLPQGLNGPRNFRIILEGCLLHEERVGSKRNEAERCAHEFNPCVLPDSTEPGARPEVVPDTGHKALCPVSRLGILAHARPHSWAYLWLMLEAILKVA
eukprot:COSAG02_NODE_3266_length_7057_cov_12.370078_5_plen_122_part_00